MELDKTQLLAYFQDQLRVDVSDIQDDTLLFSSGMVDSFAIVELLMFLEKFVGSPLGPEDINLDNLDSVERILSFVKARASEA